MISWRCLKLATSSKPHTSRRCRYIDDLIEVPAKPTPAPEPTAVDILSYNVASWDASMAYTVSEQTWVPSFTPAQALDTNETFGFEDGPAGGYLKIDAN